jgi:hypothetical protein
LAVLLAGLYLVTKTHMLDMPPGMAPQPQEVITLALEVAGFFKASQLEAAT